MAGIGVGLGSGLGSGSGSGSGSAEEIVFRYARRHVHEELAANHPNEVIREVALEVLKGTYTWTKAMNSPVYGPAVEAMTAGEGAAPTDGAAEPRRDYLAEAREAVAGMVTTVETGGEEALGSGS